MEQRSPGEIGRVQRLRLIAVQLVIALICFGFAAHPAIAAAVPRETVARIRPADSSERVASLLSTQARGGCLAQVQAASGPLLLVVGASYTAGTGAGSPLRSWAVDLADSLGWRAVVVGVPGIGYVHRSPAGVGPVSHVLRLIGDRKLAPTLVVIQAGHDDGRVPDALERARVARLFSSLKKALPGATLAAVTVFARAGRPSHRLQATDKAIVAGIASADPNAVVVDPLHDHWRFSRSFRGGLHPSARGDRQIAKDVLTQLGAAGMTIQPAAPGSEGPVCALVPRRRHRPLHDRIAGGRSADLHLQAAVPSPLQSAPYFRSVAENEPTLSTL